MKSTAHHSKAKQSRAKTVQTEGKTKYTNAVDTYTVGNEVEKMSAFAHTHTHPHTYGCARDRASERERGEKSSGSLKMRNNDTQIATECQNSKNERTTDRTVVDIKKDTRTGARARFHARTRY